eukprot:4482908-Ditylum_brightwellii.AAC.1
MQQQQQQPQAYGGRGNYQNRNNFYGGRNNTYGCRRGRGGRGHGYRNPYNQGRQQVPGFTPASPIFQSNQHYNTPQTHIPPPPGYPRPSTQQAPKFPHTSAPT